AGEAHFRQLVDGALHVLEIHARPLDRRHAAVRVDVDAHLRAGAREEIRIAAEQDLVGRWTAASIVERAAPLEAGSVRADLTVVDAAAAAADTPRRRELVVATFEVRHTRLLDGNDRRRVLRVA